VTFVGGAAQAPAVVVQPDGKIVVGGSGKPKNGGAQPQPVVLRLNGNSSLDGTFGSGGMARVSPGVSGDLYSVALQSDGKIIAAGYAWVSNAGGLFPQSQLALARYLPNGTLDPIFGSGGRVWASSTEVVNVGLGLVIQPADQKIVVAGYSMADTAAGVWRFNADGTADMGFGPGGWGWVLDPIASGSSSAGWYGIAVQSDGRIVCGGKVIMRGGTSMVVYSAIARFWQ
jgi:uncharacterized delta-60 repeat protein